MLADQKKRLYGKAVCQVAVWAVLHTCMYFTINFTLHVAERVMIGEFSVWRLSRSTPENPSTFCWKLLMQTMIANIELAAK